MFGILPFNIAKILHINTLVLWLLMGFMGSIYWFLPQELGRETAGVWAADLLFYVFCTERFYRLQSTQGPTITLQIRPAAEASLRSFATPKRWNGRIVAK